MKWVDVMDYRLFSIFTVESLIGLGGPLLFMVLALIWSFHFDKKINNDNK